MARYVDDYQGIVGHDVAPRGMDPNYRGGYGGMRMGGGRAQAEYGWYRMRHPDDFEGSGGFAGFSGRYDRAMKPRQLYHGAVQHGGRGDGGVRSLRYDRELLRDFNANSPALSRERGRYDVEQRRPLPRGISPWSRRQEPGYSNRGIVDAGYAEGWAWGPMPGAR